MPDTYTDPPQDELLSVGETARSFGVSVPTIRRWESEGKIIGTRTLGGQRRFAVSEIERVKAAS